MPPFTYRLRFLIPRDRLPHTPRDQPHLVGGPDATIELHIEQTDGNRPDNLIVIRRGVATAEEALEEAEATKRSLMRTGLLTNVPMLFGTNESSARFSQALIDRVRETSGSTLRPDVHGIEIIDEADGPTHVLRFQAEGRVGTPINLFLEELTASLGRDYSSFDVSEKLELAIEVFMAAASERTPRARFLDYVTVLEILSEERPRPHKSIEVVDKAIMELESRRADLGGEEAQSLRSSLERLRQGSIGQSVKELSRCLDAEAIAGYDEGDIGRFFSHCYGVRSQLVHEGLAPERENVSQLSGSLFFVINHLLLRLIDGAGPQQGLGTDPSPG